MRERPGETLGRWPANLVHDGSDEVLAAFPEARSSGGGGNSTGERGGAGQIWGSAGIGHDSTQEQYSDSGSSARFFYTAKADADDRLGSKHPTVKPLDLMQWLVRLVTPPGGTVLDCFAGTGTTGEAAWREGMRAVLIEAEPEYQDDIRRRMRLAATAGLAERERESIKARGKLKTVDGLPLFATLREAAE
jgi:site-specific DNA-methyltransferase (adenine-specific)